MKFQKGDKVKMTPNAVDNYGVQYQGKIFTVTHCANEYMPAKQFFDNGRPAGFHPGYDETMNGAGLYDFEELNFSMYDHEIVRAIEGAP